MLAEHMQIYTHTMIIHKIPIAFFLQTAKIFSLNTDLFHYQIVHKKMLFNIRNHNMSCL